MIEIAHPHQELIDLIEDEKCPIKIGKAIIEYFKVRKANPFVVDGIEIGTPFNLKDLIMHTGYDMIPDCLGIYHLFYEDQLVYVGMSKSIRGRLKQHIKDDDMPFNNVLWFSTREKGIKKTLQIEYNMIKKYKPVLNSKGANCR